uniref:Uncharacterized protein n=1 Tax=Klebsiella oxytoca TaxID=571 RepID=A0A1Z3MMD0_KLEOX|nr:hypothetical protein [Klebsiella oxytoca]
MNNSHDDPVTNGWINDWLQKLPGDEGSGCRGAIFVKKE